MRSGSELDGGTQSQDSIWGPPTFKDQSEHQQPAEESEKNGQ